MNYRHRGEYQPRSSFPLGLLTILVALLWGSASVQAATPPDLYGATVPISGSGQKSLDAAFDKALGQVLVKVTGRVGAADLRKELFPNSRQLLLQYRQLSEDRIFAAFDGAAIRSRLDAAGQPIWGEQRPLVSVWLAIDAGNGQRYILSDGSQDGGGRLGVMRDELLRGATQRGLPVVLPLLDARDMAKVNFTDVWGGFLEQLGSASARYNSEALLIGRTSSMATTSRDIRWTFVYAGEQSNWQGSLAQGPAQVTDMLARQGATTASSAGSVRLSIAGVNSIASYGELKKYLQGLNMITGVKIARVQSDQIEFDLAVRGDSARLQQVLQNSRLLTPGDASAGESGFDYRWQGLKR